MVRIDAGLHKVVNLQSIKSREQLRHADSFRFGLVFKGCLEFL